MRQVALESTFYVYFSTRRFSSGASFTLAGTPAIHAYEDNSDTQITAGLTLSADVDSITGLNRIAIAATAANGFEAGKHYTLTIGAGTVDSVSVVGTVVGEFIIETAAQAAARLYNESVYPLGCVIATTTGNTTGRILLTDVLDAQTADASLVGSNWAVWDATNGQVEHVTIVSVQSARLFNVVCTSDGAVMDFTVAAGDRVWFTGFSALRATVPARTLDVSTGGEAGVDWANVGSPTTAVNLSGTNIDTDQVVASVTGAVGSVTAGVTLANDAITSAKFDEATAFPLPRTVSATALGNLEDAYDGTGYDVGGIDVSEINAIVDDLLNGGRLDLLIDAIKAKTDALTFTETGNVDANVQMINDVAITGDGQPGTEFSV